MKRLLKKFVIKLMLRKGTAEYFWKIHTRINTTKNIFIKNYYKHLHYKLMDKYNASIPYSVVFGGEPTFPHGPSGIFISGGAIIGENCTIFQQVTIGSNTLPGSKACGAPSIGNNVYIGCGAKIIGGIAIGNNVRIGANCVVVQDIPDDCTVVMEKPRIIIKENIGDNRFIPYAASLNNYK